MLVGAIWDRAALEEGADDGEMAVGRGKVERGRAGRADDGCRGVTATLGVAAGESAGGVSDGKSGRADEPGGVYVCATVDEEADDEDAAAGTGGMEGQDTVEDGVDGLAVGEGVLDEADVARSGGRVEAETGDWAG